MLGKQATTGKQTAPNSQKNEEEQETDHLGIDPTYWRGLDLSQALRPGESHSVQTY